MCGIVGYIGEKNGIPIVIEGLKRLEYRGYDSSGICYHKSGTLRIKKKKGKVSDLEALISKNSFGNIVMGHTRWATHGKPSDKNAHPHISMNKKISIVHNGIIENYDSIKEGLIQRGYKFKSETDTEVLVNLIEYVQIDLKVSLIEAVQQALTQVIGAYSIAVMSSNDSSNLVLAKKGSPLVIGVGQEEHYIASDPSPFLKYTKKAIYLDDDEVAEISKKKLSILTFDKKIKSPTINKLTMELEEIEKGGFETFMLKEIYEQPKSIVDTLRGRIIKKSQIIKLRGFNESVDTFKRAKRIVIVACGTSWIAGLVAEYIIEGLAKLPVEVEYASEFRYRNPIIYKNDIVIAFSQSGETADTISALKLAKENGALLYGICNVVGSSISRLVNVGTFTHAGPEIGVASTKAFTAQVSVSILIALAIAKLRKQISKNDFKEITDALLSIHEKMQYTLSNCNNKIKQIARKYKNSRNALYLGRGLSFPVALEGALKLKEISYIHAEGYPAAEMKHGPIALIDENMPTIIIATNKRNYEKIFSNAQEIKARNGKLIAIVSQGDNQISKIADHVIEVPKTNYYLSPLINTIPLQLFSYYIASFRGCNVDQPRNLAKSVTVE
tara:strand:+ start:1968 stop:3806 length:1839 start_codon:yes stop_codon:yes gene_type:complete